MDPERLQQIINPLEEMLSLYGFNKVSHTKKNTEVGSKEGIYEKDLVKIKYYLHLLSEEKHSGVYKTELEFKVELSEYGEKRKLWDEHIRQNQNGTHIIKQLVRDKIRDEIYKILTKNPI